MAMRLPKSVFYHIPKTGGMWVRAAIARAGIPVVELGNETNPAANLHNNYQIAYIPGKFKFCFVRHPLAWYPSFWNYRMLTGWQTDDAVDPCMAVDFEEFIRRVLRRFPQGHLMQRYERYVGPPGTIHFVGRTERLADDLVRALRLAGEKFDEERLRRAPFQNTSPLRPVLPDPLKAALLRSERRVLERFGYEEDPHAPLKN